MCAFLSIEVNAQSKAKGVSAKVNGKLWKSDETNSSAVWDSIEQSLSIMAVKPETGEYLNFKLISVGNLYSKGFRVGEYYFSQKTNFLDNYSASAFYIASENGKQSYWNENNLEEFSPGKIQITEITPTTITGKFYFDLVKNNIYSFDVSNVVSITEGEFSLSIQSSKVNASTQPVPSTPAVPSTSSSTSNFKLPFGIYDIQIALGVNWMKPKQNLNLDGDFGTNYSFGFTAVNLEYGNSGASGTVALFYDYSRQNAEDFLGSWHFRRNELFARIKPFTNNPVYSNSYGGNGSMYLLGILFSGLYADVGYTNGTYFYKNYLDVKQAPNYQQNGFFWGWGYNMVHRNEDSRWGMSVGYGSKIYTWTKANGDRAKYSSRTIWIGVSYNLVWME